jgi:hypothetical protein
MDKKERSSIHSGPIDNLLYAAPRRVERTSRLLMWPECKPSIAQSAADLVNALDLFAGAMATVRLSTHARRVSQASGNDGGLFKKSVQRKAGAGLYPRSRGGVNEADHTAIYVFANL